MKIRKVLFYIFLTLAVAVNVLIIVESCIGGEGSAAQSFSFSEAIANMIESIFPGAIKDHEAFHSAIRKLVGHFLLFGLSGTFTALTFVTNDFMMNKFKWKNIIFILSIGLVIALTSELIQYFVPGRYGVLTDVLIDYSGYLIFAGIVYMIYTLIILNKNKQNKNPE